MLSKRLLFVSASVMAGMTLGTTAFAGYVLRWSSNLTFPVGYNMRVEPFPPVFIGDVDGDGQMEFVGQPYSDDIRLEVRDAMTGTLEETIQVGATTGGRVHGVTIFNVDGLGSPEIVVTLSSAGSAPTQNGFAIYGWSGASVGTPHLGAEGAQRLLPASPNPFAPRTTLSFVVDAPGRMELEVFDVGGRRVRRFIEPSATPGEHRVLWEGNDDSGRQLAAGTYFYTLKIDGRVAGSRKAVLLQ